MQSLSKASEWGTGGVCSRRGLCMLTAQGTALITRWRQPAEAAAGACQPSRSRLQRTDGQPTDGRTDARTNHTFVRCHVICASICTTSCSPRDIPQDLPWSPWCSNPSPSGWVVELGGVARCRPLTNLVFRVLLPCFWLHPITLLRAYAGFSRLKATQPRHPSVVQLVAMDSAAGGEETAGSR